MSSKLLRFLLKLLSGASFALVSSFTAQLCCRGLSERVRFMDATEDRLCIERLGIRFGCTEHTFDDHELSSVVLDDKSRVQTAGLNGLDLGACTGPRHTKSSCT
jgi:hypothetical protein